MTKEIKLTHGAVTQVDDEDYNFLMQFKWHLTNCGYAVRRSPRVNGALGRMILMHRVILNAPENLTVDHIDGNPLNNTRANIRLAEHWQNMLNKKVRKDSRTGIKGVQKHGNKYRVYVGLRGIRHLIGSFDSIEEASAAYQSAALRLHGEFACIDGRIN